MSNFGLGLSQLLRFVLAGGVYLISLYVITKLDKSHGDSVLGISDPDTVFFSAAVLISGSIIYTLHRSLAYPLMYRLIVRCLLWRGVYRLEQYRGDRGFSQNSDGWGFAWFHAEFLNSKRRWSAKNQTGSLLLRLEPWADETHFLYCSAWAVVFAIFTASVRQKSGGLCFESPPMQIALTAWLVAALFIFAGLVHGIRGMIWEHRLLEEKGVVRNKHV